MRKQIAENSVQLLGDVWVGGSGNRKLFGFGAGYGCELSTELFDSSFKFVECFLSYRKPEVAGRRSERSGLAFLRVLA